MNKDEFALINKLKERIKDPRRFIDAPEAFPYKLYPPVSVNELVEAEKRLGFRLPNVLREIYLQVGNGGFGPGFGLLALNKNGSKNFQLDLVEWYLESIHFSHSDYPSWPRQFITICDWGDGIVSEMDWTSPQAPIYRFNGDRYENGPFEEAMNYESPSLNKWLEDWLNNIPLYSYGKVSTK